MFLEIHESFDELPQQQVNKHDHQCHRHRLYQIKNIKAILCFLLLHVLFPELVLPLAHLQLDAKGNHQQNYHRSNPHKLGQDVTRE